MERVVQNVAPALIAASLAATAASASARDRIHIVGSSTVFPYTNVVADNFAANSAFPRPDVISTGTGGGMELFCVGNGLDTPDISGASRKMKRSEFDLCRQNGVWPITEVPIGYDGLSIAISRFTTEDFALTLKDVYTALAAEVPVDGKLVANPYKKWSDVRPELPDVPISVIGPPPTSGTRDSFEELALAAGCVRYAFNVSLQDTDPDKADAVCSTLRTDGPFIEAGEDDEAIVAQLKEAPNTLGVMGFGYVYEHQAELKPVPINGVEPDFLTIATQEYPLSRPLYIYIKNQHEAAVPGMSAFINEYVWAMHPNGYLFVYGLVPHFADVDFEQIAGEAIDGVPMMPPLD